MRVVEFGKDLRIVRKIEKFFNYAGRLARWVREQFSIAIIVFFSIVIGYLIMRFFYFSEPAVRLVGLAFQIAGLFPVAFGIRGAMRIFDHPTIWASAKEAWRRRPRWEPEPVSLALHATVGAMCSAVGMTQRKNVSADSSIQERVDALEFNLREIETDALQFKKQTEKNIEKIKDDINTTHSESAAKITDISLKLKSANIDGIGWAIAGIVWIALGITLSTTSIEVHNMLRVSPRHAQRIEVRL